MGCDVGQARSRISFSEQAYGLALLQQAARNLPSLSLAAGGLRRGTVILRHRRLSRNQWAGRSLIHWNCRWTCWIMSIACSFSSPWGRAVHRRVEDDL